MIKKGNLYFLIKSLNKAEKRHFNSYCSNRKVNKNYLLLFAAYDRQESLDEGEIKAQFRGKAFAKQLHVTKNYLYKLLLKSLRNYHTSLSKDAQLKDLLRNIEILFYKELPDHCEIEIQKAEKIALQYEHQQALLQLYGWKRKIHLSKYGSRQKDELNNILQLEEACIHKIKRQNEYWQIMSNIFDPKHQSHPLPDHPLLQNASSDDPLETKILHYHILYTHYVVNRKSAAGYQSLVQLVDIMEQTPHRIQEDPNAYITVLNNQIGYLIHAHQYDQVVSLLEKVRAVPEEYELKDKKKYAFKLLLRTYNVELEMYRDTHAFEKANELIQQIEIFIEQNKKGIPSDYRLMYWYQFANIFFMQKDYPQSLKWVNAIIEARFNGLRMDLESYARLLNLILHFELDNRIVLRYSIESCRRFLKKKNKIAPFEKVLLQFFSKVSNAPKVEHADLLQQLYDQLFDSEPPLVSDHVLDYLDFRFWLEGRGKTVNGKR